MPATAIFTNNTEPFRSVVWVHILNHEVESWKKIGRVGRDGRGSELCGHGAWTSLMQNQSSIKDEVGFIHRPWFDTKKGYVRVVPPLRLYRTYDGPIGRLRQTNTSVKFLFPEHIILDMHVSDKRIQEFIEIWRAEFGEDLTFNEARQHAFRLMELYSLLAENAQEDERKQPTQTTIE